jgi:hypothetical protein
MRNVVTFRQSYNRPNLRFVTVWSSGSGIGSTV